MKIIWLALNNDSKKVKEGLEKSFSRPSLTGVVLFECFFFQYARIIKFFGFKKIW